jgi:type I restriction-modification system DNA methylase subunit
MTISTKLLQSLAIADESQRVGVLREVLGYPILEKDEPGSRFWYLRSGETAADAGETCPIAVAFYSELDEPRDFKAYFTKGEAEQEIRAHYLNRVNEQQPVLYLLLPLMTSGAVVAILPKDFGKIKGIRQRDVLAMALESREFAAFLQRLGQESIGKLRQRVQDQFLAYVPLVDFLFVPVSKTAKELAEALAGIAREMEQQIPVVYQLEATDGYLHRLLESFKKELLPNLKVSSENQKDYSFADVYAQTIAYGLFTARVFGFIGDEAAEFTLTGAWACLPETNPFLKQLFRDLSHEDLGAVLNSCLAKISLLLERAEMRDILADFQQKLDREDIVIRFYEDFLAAYKPQMRERRGVYYTPEPVVSYMVRSVDELIKDKFGKPLGIADPEVKILDPACGTGTFLLWIFRLIHQRFVENPAAFEGFTDWNEYVSKGLLPRIYGFELLVAPYAICHLKLGLFLEETGYQFDSGQRLEVYLINTLDDLEAKIVQMSFIEGIEKAIAEEARQGTAVKEKEPIMLVIGNPPYSGHSENNDDWIKDLVKDYYFVDGKPLGERNPKWLQDDYVKFIRFAQWRIDKSQQGILGFITNHGFLDNPTFRGMRQSLMNSFDEIFIYDLHGNSKKKETTPDGGKDENVFDIQQGVSISFMLKGGSINDIISK